MLSWILSLFFNPNHLCTNQYFKQIIFVKLNFVLPKWVLHCIFFSNRIFFTNITFHVTLKECINSQICTLDKLYTHIQSHAQTYTYGPPTYPYRPTYIYDVPCSSKEFVSADLIMYSEHFQFVYLFIHLYLFLLIILM